LTCAAVVVAAFLFVLYTHTYVSLACAAVLVVVVVVAVDVKLFGFTTPETRIRIFEEEKMKNSTTLDDSEVRVAAFDADPLLNDTELQSYIKLVEKGCNRSSGPVRERRFYPERRIERD
jgi:hypothetical protein